MNVLLVTDGSSYSTRAAQMLRALELPVETRVKILTVVPEPTFLGGISLDVIRGVGKERMKQIAQQERNAEKLIQKASETLGDAHYQIESVIRWGNPKKVILAEADDGDVSLIVMGAKGITDSSTFRLGGVSLAVMKHARASVLLARKVHDVTQKVELHQEIHSLKRLLLATDGSAHSENILKYLLDLPLPKRCEVIVITSLISYLPALISTPSLDLKHNQELLGKLQMMEEEKAKAILAGYEKTLRSRGYPTTTQLVKGAAAESILVAAQEYHPDLVALGSRGLSGIKSLLVGSVAERVSRYANCSVLIGRF